MRIYSDRTVDQEFADLGTLGFTGSLNDRQIAYLKSYGLTGSLSDLMGKKPSLVLDFINFSVPSSITFSRSSSANYFNSSGVLTSAATNTPRIDYDPVSLQKKGLLIESARSNLFLNSATPATQDIAVTAQSYALSFRGTGSITLSGAHAAVVNGTGASQRVDLVFTPTAGTLTLTLSGSVIEPQLEAGTCATSHIVTAGTATARSDDRASLALSSWWNAAEGTFCIDWQDINYISGATRVLAANGATTIINLFGNVAPNNSNQLQAFNTSVALTRNHGADVTKGTRRAAMAYSAAGRSLAFGGVVSTDANLLALTTLTTLYLGHSDAFTLPINGYLRRVAYWPRRLSDAELVVMTT